MGKLTFVIEFEDGKEPPVHAHMEAFGGKVVAVAFRDALSEDDHPKTIATFLGAFARDAVFYLQWQAPYRRRLSRFSPTVVSHNA
ncbi:hypothetical protein [Enterobacter cloacae complex sp. 277I4]|uniref:hypothetical protein n=1 Tax=Enterobacter cloacae complex sp. 277I4 TaxID=3395873 RepID=UPI003CECC124